jgi:hypothetical protein
VLVSRFNDPERAIAHLGEAGVRCFDTTGLMARCEGDG